MSERAEMEEDEPQSRAEGGVATHWWWAAGSAAQLGWGVASFRKGHGGSANMMPLKAFAVASLFVGAAASATVAAIRASGIHKVSHLSCPFIGSHIYIYSFYWYLANLCKEEIGNENTEICTFFF